MDSKYGVPTVAIHTNAFEKVVQSVTQLHGMPQARYTFVPQPVMGKTAEQLRAYVDGKSPISGRPVMQEVIEGLTRPAEGDRVKEIKFERSTPRLVGADAEENLDRLFLENNWTDKLPIILPTEKRWRKCWRTRAGNRTKSWGTCARTNFACTGSLRWRGWRLTRLWRGHGRNIFR